MYRDNPWSLIALWVLAVGVVLTSLTGLAVAAETEPVEFVKGITWGWVGSRGEYSGPQAASSMQKLAETNATSVCIAFSTSMPTYDDPNFRWAAEEPSMVTDDEIRRAIRLARDHGLQVILKPTVNCRDNVWRAWIRFFRPMTSEEQAAGTASVNDPWGDNPGVREGMVVDEAKWNTWWKNYEGFLLHYAKLAAEENVELFCLGCEMNSTEEFVPRWRNLIAAVRASYSGPLVYNCNHGRENSLPWWDVVDVIGISAYYQVPPPEGQSLEEAVLQTTPKEQLLAEFSRVKQELRQMHARLGKPILFIETGVTSVRGCARYPWSHPGAYPESVTDHQEQANYYQAMFETFWGEPWFLGFAWWDWPARLYPSEQADSDRGFCVYGKRAEQVLREWYRKQPGVLPAE